MKKTIADKTGFPVGFLGPVGLDLKIYADHEVGGMHDFVTGANKPDTHLTAVQLKRDIKITEMLDLREVIAGDACPRCENGHYQIRRGIEVGHIFILGTKYSKAMKAHFLDPNGKEQPFVMGCYGIGVGRTAAAAIEQNHDEKGIIWPPSLAPFQVSVIPVNQNAEPVKEAAEKIYQMLVDGGIEALLDDRKDRLGSKLKDAELTGIPVQIVIGPKNLEAGNLEVKFRKTGESRSLPFPGESDDLVAMIKAL